MRGGGIGGWWVGSYLVFENNVTCLEFLDVYCLAPSDASRVYINRHIILVFAN